MSQMTAAEQIDQIFEAVLSAQRERQNKSLENAFKELVLQSMETPEQQEILKLKEQLEKEEKDHDETKSKLETAESELSANNFAIGRLNSHIHTLHSQVTPLRNELIKFHGKNGELQELLKKNEKQRKTLVAMNDDGLKNFQKTLEEKDRKIRELTEALFEKQSAFEDQSEEEREEAQIKESEKDLEISKLKEALSQAQETVDLAKRDLKKQKEDFSKEIDGIWEYAEKVEVDLKENKRIIRKLKAEKKELEEKSQKTTREFVTLKPIAQAQKTNDLIKKEYQSTNEPGKDSREKLVLKVPAYLLKEEKDADLDFAWKALKKQQEQNRDLEVKRAEPKEGIKSQKQLVTDDAKCFANEDSKKGVDFETMFTRQLYQQLQYQLHQDQQYLLQLQQYHMKQRQKQERQ